MVGDAIRSAQIERLGSGKACLVKLAGVVDEQFDGPGLVAAVRGVVVIDLDGVRGITSYGVREWVRAMRELRSDYLGFARCRPCMVDQFNLVSGFAGRGEVLSFYLPYLCPRCREFEVLVDATAPHPALLGGEPPARPCPTCGQAADFDDIAATYLQFISAQPTPQPPALVHTILAGGAEAPPLGIEKEISGGVTGLWLSGELDGARRFKRLEQGLEGAIVVVLRGVTEATPSGVAALAGFIASAGPQARLVRVPARFVPDMRATPALGDAIASIDLEVRCPHCAASTIMEVDAATAAAIQTGTSGDAVCQSCGRRGLGKAAKVALSALAPRLQPLDADPRAYLAARPSAPIGAGKGAETFGRYELVAPLATGGMAEVFLARQTGAAGFRKLVVMKRILPALCADKSFVRGFLAEAHLAARLHHPNIVEIYDLGEVGGRYFMCLEYVRGWDLSLILRACADAGRPPPVEIALYIAREVCLALAAVHSCAGGEGQPHGIVHGDVSTSNVLVSQDGHVKLGDFGIARAVAGAVAPSSPLRGKVAYLAPEHLTNKDHVDERADVFAAGVLLHELLTLRPPFERRLETLTVKTLADERAPLVSRARRGVPRALDAILERALTRDLRKRYRSGEAMRAELDALIAARGLRASAAELQRFLRDLPLDRSQPAATDASPSVTAREPTRATHILPSRRS